MGLRYWRRKIRCILRHGPRGCPHIERHSRRRRVRNDRQPPAPAQRHRKVAHF